MLSETAKDYLWLALVLLLCLAILWATIWTVDQWTAELRLVDPVWCVCRCE